MDELMNPEAATEELDATTEAADIAADEQEAASTPPEAEEDEDAATPEETPQKPAKTAPPTMEERMLEMLLRERHPDTLATALASGKTIRGAWNYVVSVMKNAYIARHGRVNGGMCGDPDVVVGIAERYLREFDEGTLEPEAAHKPTKPTKADGKTDAAKVAVATVKAAATAAKKEAKIEAKRKPQDCLGKAPKDWKPSCVVQGKLF